jgi:hypothetical protein
LPGTYGEFLDFLQPDCHHPLERDSNLHIGLNLDDPIKATKPGNECEPGLVITDLAFVLLDQLDGSWLRLRVLLSRIKININLTIAGNSDGQSGDLGTESERSTVAIDLNG